MTVPDSIYWHAYLLELLLAESATWQSICGVGSAEAARAYIHYPFIDDPGPPPRAIISDDADLSSWTAVKISIASFRVEGPTLALEIDIPIPDATQALGIKEVGYYVAEKIGKIIGEMMALSGTGDIGGDHNVSHLNVERIIKTNGPAEIPQEEEETIQDVASNSPVNAWYATFLVEYA